MHNIISLKTFQLKYNKHMKLVAAFTGNKKIHSILKMCRLKPYEFLFSKERENKLYSKWVDEFGSSLNLNKKDFIIINNDLSIDNSKILCTDYYYGLPIETIIKMSNILYFIYGEDDVTGEQYYFIALVGVDGYLRCFLYEDGWTQVSPLSMGLRHLNHIADSLDETFYKKFVNKDNLPFPCVNGEAWLTYLPAGEAFYRKINKHELIKYLIQTKENK